MDSLTFLSIYQKAFKTVKLLTLSKKGLKWILKCLFYSFEIKVCYNHATSLFADWDRSLSSQTETKELFWTWSTSPSNHSWHFWQQQGLLQVLFCSNRFNRGEGEVLEIATCQVVTIFKEGHSKSCWYFHGKQHSTIGR